MAIWSKLAGYAVNGVAVGIVLAVINDSYASLTLFQGDSMNPTIKSSDIGLCNKATPFWDIRRGDIVIAASPKQPGIQICKRVIALEGDEVSYQKDNIREPDDNMKFKNTRYIPRGHVWLEGDNKESSLDSRNFGPIPLGLVKSRVIGKLYPFRNATIFSRESPNEEWAERRR